MLSAPASVVIFQAKVSDELLAHHMAKGVLQLHRLNEQVMLGIKPGRSHRRFEVEAEPLLNPEAAKPGRPLGEIEEKHQVKRDRRCEDRVAAEEIHLDLHRIAKPAKDIDVVPALFIITARRIIVNPNLVVNILVQVGVKLRLQDEVQHPQLRLFLGLERLGIVEYLAVTVAENVGRIPSGYAEHARLEGRRQYGFHKGLASLEVLAADR